MIDFQTPWVLVLIPIVLGLVYFFNRGNKPPSFKFSSVNLARGLPQGLKIYLNQRLFVLRFLAILFFLLALAGPRKILEQAKYKTEGIDIILAIDTSGSMAAEDFKVNGKRVNRLDVVKNVVEEFISKRPDDRIGVVAFARFAYTVCPLTFDQDWLLTNLERIKLGLIEDGTAIGSAIASSVARLRDSHAKSKIIILLTDGVNNAGKISPETAAKMAQALGIRVYTIGAGTKGLVPFPVTDVWGRRGYQNVQINLDDKSLKAIAKTTGAKFFEATDTDSLRAVYGEIDKMEKTEIFQTGYKRYDPLFWIFLLLGMGILFLEIILSRTWLLKIP
ncbi:MAG: VWA domain-containing protein [Candidatus Aceula meridiana]|nr:VWA domain-containing protein [Candidatus Aceula meridiana]